MTSCYASSQQSRNSMNNQKTSTNPDRNSEIHAQVIAMNFATISASFPLALAAAIVRQYEKLLARPGREGEHGATRHPTRRHVISISRNNSNCPAVDSNHSTAWDSQTRKVMAIIRVEHGRSILYSFLVDSHLRFSMVSQILGCGPVRSLAPVYTRTIASVAKRAEPQHPPSPKECGTRIRRYLS
ncbi:hypothetical protein P175DRAFT_0554153 [Aspergillus ochraceoroseus IBT 24754]|uniref:Uncharacterized protein n=1 Tax=Aspergillus ochraceoroseus IBT 24754 TaxID=1392256 RepID=A0A2T5M8P2_9EURO|nr:uncharacterized protein P175DRAFT_0554153 [Aspergillus ochraceoroseus IBT 24754]PTU24897.1 hypothetical protein P175DRAFT_0554153 [Aspergillus ochraceoroseus IBT 24754]